MGDSTALGNRMKRYEAVTKQLMPRRTYTIVRVDGKAFHTFCRDADKPFDRIIHACMVYTAQSLLSELQGAQLGYTQSDEISILLCDFARVSTEAAFDNSVQKLASVSASIATAAFGECYGVYRDYRKALFDARVFTVPDPVEVGNYFVWRQKDATRNSVSMAAHSMFSPKQLHGKNFSAMQDMMWNKGTNWNDYPDWAKRGTCVFRDEEGIREEDPPVFTRHREWLDAKIPAYTYDD